MQRRGPARIRTALATVACTVARSVAFLIAVVVSAVIVSAVVSAPGSVSAGAADDAPPEPSDTVTEFFPESANLSDCVGLVEKPGCGSEARGGWGQTAVFVAVFVGLAVVAWRISRGIRANRTIIDGATEADRPVDDRREY